MELAQAKNALPSQERPEVMEEWREEREKPERKA